MRRARWWWAGYGACAIAVLAALAYLSRAALAFERGTVTAATHALFQDRLRLALWRMDSLVLPLLSREGARPYFEYLAYFPQERSYNRFLTELQKGEVLTPSPLLNAAPQYILLHFQVDREGKFSSPQVPDGNLRDLAEATCLPVGAVSARTPWLADVCSQVSIDPVRDRVLEAERNEAELFGRLLAPRPETPVPPTRPFDANEMAARQNRAYKSKLDAQSAADSATNNSNLENVDAGGSGTAPKAVAVIPPGVHVGTLIPLWLGKAKPELFLFRRVTVGEVEFLQGIWLDWTALDRALIDEVGDVLPGCRLEPLRAADSNWATCNPTSLATIPVRLVASEVPARAEIVGAWRPVHATLLLTWGATAAALIAAGFVLRAILALGERRNRFASAVTHELRTPLTTFRMYSEMLADDMVREPEQRALYLQTLKEESTRLSTLVENVLAYARLEDGRGTVRKETVEVAELFARHQAALERRARDAGLALIVTGTLPAARVVTDVDAVGQVLFNLVDNASKYAKAAPDASSARIEISARAEARHVVLRVRDFGPGIPADLARRIFAPFDRGSRDGDPAPGVGLGLALARGIAADLGGALELAVVDGPGAAFDLSLPRGA